MVVIILLVDFLFLTQNEGNKCYLITLNLKDVYFDERKTFIEELGESGNLDSFS